MTYNRPLTDKQERFCQEYIKHSNATRAYRAVYDTDNMTTKTVWESACKTRNKPKVKTRITELQAELAQEFKDEMLVDRKMISTMLEEAAEMAREKGDAANYRGASMDLAKLHGLLVDKIEKKDIPIDREREEIAKRVAMRLVEDKSA